jgi:hypothetical protein
MAYSFMQMLRWCRGTGAHSGTRCDVHDAVLDLCTTRQLQTVRFHFEQGPISRWANLFWWDGQQLAENFPELRDGTLEIRLVSMLNKPTWLIMRRDGESSIDEGKWVSDRMRETSDPMELAMLLLQSENGSDLQGLLAVFPATSRREAAEEVLRSAQQGGAKV